MNSLQKMISNTSTQTTSTVEKTCPLCNKKFIPKGRQKYCDGPHFKPCPTCGKTVPAPYPSDPAKFCSSECRKKFKFSSEVSLIQSKVNEASPIPVKPKLEVTEPPKKEHPIDPDLQLSKEHLKPLDKGVKEFFTKECIFDTKIKGLIKGHIYDIEVIKEGYVYEVTLTHDHNYNEDLNTTFLVASAISFNNYFK